MHDRRTFLKGLGALGATAALSLAPTARASNICEYKILEVFLHGAVDHRETLWVDDGPGPNANAPHRVDPGALDVPIAANPIAFLSAGEVVGLDHDIVLGAGLHPLMAAGAIDNMRLIAMTANVPNAHTLAAGPALTGNVIGNPTAVSLGARIQYNVGEAPVPASWVIDCGTLPRIAQMAAAIGAQPGWTRPFQLKMGTNVVSQLNRVGRQSVDPLLEMYRERYGNRLQGVRSAAFDTYSATALNMFNWEAVYDLLQSSPASLSAGSTTFMDYSGSKLVKAVPVASHLLANGARHVCLVGNRSDLDTHGFPGADLLGHARHHNHWMWHLCDAIRAAVVLGDLDLSTTLVVFHSEFGRFLDGEDGSEHWIDGFPAMCFGGPISGRGLAGRLDFSSEPHGTAVNPVNPAQLLNALSLSAGIPHADIDEVAPAAIAAKVLGTTCELGFETI